jgi:hypothetical protein
MLPRGERRARKIAPVLTGPTGAVRSVPPGSDTLSTYPTVDESRQRLQTFGWSVGETGGASTWLVTGTRGKARIRAEGHTQGEAWWQACIQVCAVASWRPRRKTCG